MKNKTLDTVLFEYAMIHVIFLKLIKICSCFISAGEEI